MNRFHNQSSLSLFAMSKIQHYQFNSCLVNGFICLSLLNNSIILFLSIMNKALFSILCMALLSACTHHNSEFSNPQTYADNTHDWYLDLSVTHVQFTDTATILTISCKSRVPEYRICIAPQAYLSDQKDRHYNVLFMAEHQLGEFFPVVPAGSTIHVGFEPMPSSTRIFDMIEGTGMDAFKIIGIHDSSFIPAKPKFPRHQQLEAEQLRRQIFKSGAVTIFGTIEGYDANQGYQTYAMHYTDYPTGQSNTLSLEIDPDGRFEKTLDVNGTLGASIVDQNSDWHDLIAQAGDTLYILFHKDGTTDYYLSEGRPYPLKNYNRLAGVNVVDYARFSYDDAIILADRQAYSLDCQKRGREYIDYITSKYNLTAFEYQYAGIMLENSIMMKYLEARLYTEVNAISSAATDGFIDYSVYQKVLSSVDSLRLVPSILEYMSSFPANDTLILLLPHRWTIFNYYRNDPVFKTARINRDSLRDVLDDVSEVFVYTLMVDSINLENDKRLYGTSEPTLYGKICCMEGFENDMATLLHRAENRPVVNVDSVMSSYLGCLKKLLNDSNLEVVADRIYRDFMRKQSPYWELPECRGKEVLKGILASYPGKYVYLDFWSTSCGPCIAGIKDCFKYRRELITGQYDQFALVFITSDSERAYEPFRKEWLDGAQSYRISEDDWNALAGLFNFSGIPHHEMITPDGMAITDVVEMLEVDPNNPDPKQK